MGSQHFDFVVIGGGLMGLSSACSLAERRKNVLLIEQSSPEKPITTSSSGQTRITSKIYTEPFYIAMVEAATQKYELLERQTGIQFLSKVGAMEVGDVTEIVEALKATSVSHEHIQDCEELARKCTSGFRVPQATEGVYEPNGSLIHAPKCLQALTNHFVSLGGTMKLATVQHVQCAPLIQVVCEKKRYTCDRLIVTVGPWAPSFLKHHLQLDLPIYANRTISCYWMEKIPGQYSGSRTPVIMSRESDGLYYYLKPSVEQPGWLNFGVHWGVECSMNDPSAKDKELTEQYLVKCRKWAEKYKLNLDIKNPVVSHCIYTESPDKFILDNHPKFPNVTIGTGFSGRGFKFGPVIGEILADLAMNRQPKFDMRHFRINRFAGMKL